MESPIIKKFKYPMFEMIAKIYDNYVLVNTNNPQVTKLIYELGKKDNRDVLFIDRTRTVVEHYPGMSKEEIDEAFENQYKEIIKKKDKYIEDKKNEPVN